MSAENTDRIIEAKAKINLGTAQDHLDPHMLPFETDVVLLEDHGLIYGAQATIDHVGHTVSVIKYGRTVEQVVADSLSAVIPGVREVKVNNPVWGYTDDNDPYVQVRLSNESTVWRSFARRGVDGTETNNQLVARAVTEGMQYGAVRKRDKKL